jgi:hypothetical protein
MDRYLRAGVRVLDLREVGQPAGPPGRRGSDRHRRLEDPAPLVLLRTRKQEANHKIDSRVSSRQRPIRRAEETERGKEDGADGLPWGTGGAM